ncbi:hypothetical protein DPMN_073135 [Dreissena polymorpha]|uniref:Uncharacterized protein n=1 Tax=Dreissena polymorpha TaxID=45954 RepID=A0A9D4BYH5_DREPO|nr:hypothetical protein DPMN_073135 [Dreissena polymorpha]
MPPPDMDVIKEGTWIQGHTEGSPQESDTTTELYIESLGFPDLSVRRERERAEIRCTWWEQLAEHTDEESVILTASVADGTLSHLGSESGKSYLDDHEDVKSSFLGFCLKSKYWNIKAERHMSNSDGS